MGLKPLEVDNETKSGTEESKDGMIYIMITQRDVIYDVIIHNALWIYNELKLLWISARFRLMNL